MEQNFDFMPIIQIAPLAILIVLAVWMIRRGSRQKPHDKGNIGAGGSHRPGDWWH
jgi:ABC-type nickel/cobalt efflux system permease component RcnA